MKKFLIILIIVLSLLGVYFNRSYARIYNLIGEKKLPNPTIQQDYFVGDKNVNKNIKIAFLGDSLTAGVGATDWQKTYPYLLAKKISDGSKTQVEVLNLGVPSATSADVLKKQVTIANNFNSDKVVIFVGINDLHNFVGKNQLENNLKQIITNLKIDKKNIYLVNIPYLGSKQSFFWPYQNYFYFQTNKYYTAIINVWRDTNVKQVDVFLATSKSFLNNSSWYAVDGFHPNDQGYEQIAKSIYYYMFNVVNPL